jgi:hypothetical protein
VEERERREQNRRRMNIELERRALVEKAREDRSWRWEENQLRFKSSLIERN